MIKKINPKDLAATWVIEQELTGAPGLLGTEVKIEISQVNPFAKIASITPTKASPSDEKFHGVFAKIKPMVTTVQEDVVLCSLGIIARRKT